ncbi:MAG TPA: winged helix-turn-helix transcriptional regulator [Solirubrobacterales bacterium]|jgi:DNA-binding HxlR family transcriptional regulator|nr:winged helix-turn-helix transcriptional regulator [Solirubrobacterales bacterium]
MAQFDAAASSDGEVRAGSRVLSVFENPLNARILRAHASGPLRLNELQDKLGWSAQTTVRAAVSGLHTFGALNKETVGKSPYAVANALTPAGEEMLFVADEVEAWLALCPDGPIAAESEGAKGAVKALAGGWSSTLMRALANRPFTLTELDSLIPDVNYPALERRISWMRTTGQIEPAEKEGRATPYVVTDWLRRAIAPLCAAGRCERRHMEAESGPITSIEVEASFLLAMPLAPLPGNAGGTCMLAAQTDPVEPDRGNPELAGVTIEVRRGKVLACAPQLHAEPPTWAVGTPEAWLDAVIDGRIGDLRVGGANPQLALDLVSGIHFALFTDR